MAAAIPGAELLLINGVGHAVFVDEPKIFAQALQRLISRPVAAGN
jgi:pimeloyl-ACP methyl ester carboxylesterase